MVLEHVTATAALWRHMHASGAVKQQPIVYQNTAFVGTRETGDAVQSQRLSGAARAEQHGYTGARMQVDVQLECFGIAIGREALQQPRVDEARGRVAQAALLRRDVRDT